MAKLIQICASQNDLFGLDGEGRVYQFNFNSKTWVTLESKRDDDGGLSVAEDQTIPRSRSAVPPWRR